MTPPYTTSQRCSRNDTPSTSSLKSKCSHTYPNHLRCKQEKIYLNKKAIRCRFEGIDEDILRVHFSSKKLMELGYKFQYTMEDMFDEAIRSCCEKKLIPFHTAEGHGSEVVKKKPVNSASERVSEFSEKDVLIA